MVPELDELDDAEELVSSLSEKAYLVFQPILSSSRLFADQKLLRAFGLRSFGLGTDVVGSRRGREGVFEFAMVLIGRDMMGCAWMINVFVSRQ